MAGAAAYATDTAGSLWGYALRGACVAGPGKTQGKGHPSGLAPEG